MGFIFFPEDLTLEEYKTRVLSLDQCWHVATMAAEYFFDMATFETLNWIFLLCQHEHLYVLADFKRTQGVLTEKQKTYMCSCWHLEIFHSENGIKWLHVWFQAMINSQANMITWMSYVFLIEHHLGYSENKKHQCDHVGIGQKQRLKLGRMPILKKP